MILRWRISFFSNINETAEEAALFSGAVVSLYFELQIESDFQVLICAIGTQLKKLEERL